MENYRIIFFLTIFIIFIILENIKPAFKQQKYSSHLRANILLFIFSVITLKLAFPFEIYSLAIKFNEQSLSLLNFNQFPYYIDLILTLIIFDFAIYFQHRIFHVLPVLWKAHKVHHCDTSMDITTALRFHPVEILLSGIYKICLLMLLGPRAEVYIIYEICLNGFAIFTHSNFKISKKVDTLLRSIFVTPAMHTSHHSPIKNLTNSNYGNILSIWDRLFKSYSAQDNNHFGLDDVKKEHSQDIKELLKMAFR